MAADAQGSHDRPDAPAHEQRDEEAVRRFVEQFAITLDSWGFPRMPGRVLMTLMTAEDDGLTAAELSERLGVSQPAISGAIGYLTRIGFVVKDPVPGSRRDLYRMQDDAWYAVSLAKSTLMDDLAAQADTGVTALGGPSTRAGARVAQMRDFYKFIRKEMDDMLARWAAHRDQAP